MKNNMLVSAVSANKPFLSFRGITVLKIYKKNHFIDKFCTLIKLSAGSELKDEIIKVLHNYQINIGNLSKERYIFVCKNSVSNEKDILV